MARHEVELVPNDASWLTYQDRRKGGLTNWDKHHRIPPGRKALPRLKRDESEMAGTPRGGFARTRKAMARKEVGISAFDSIT